MDRHGYLVGGRLCGVIHEIERGIAGLLDGFGLESACSDALELSESWYLILLSVMVLRQADAIYTVLPAITTMIMAVRCGQNIAWAISSRCVVFAQWQ
jgi:hypothetical protein